MPRSAHLLSAMSCGAQCRLQYRPCILPAGREVTDVDRLDLGLKNAQQIVAESGGLSSPLVIAESVALPKFEEWAHGKTVRSSCLYQTRATRPVAMLAGM